MSENPANISLDDLMKLVADSGRAKALEEQVASLKAQLGGTRVGADSDSGRHWMQTVLAEYNRMLGAAKKNGTMNQRVVLIDEIIDTLRDTVEPLVKRLDEMDDKRFGTGQDARSTAVATDSDDDLPEPYSERKRQAAEALRSKETGADSKKNQTGLDDTGEDLPEPYSERKRKSLGRR